MGEDVVKDIKFQRHWTTVHQTYPPDLGIDERIDKFGRYCWIIAVLAVYPVSLLIALGVCHQFSWLFRGLVLILKNSTGGWLVVGCFVFLFLAMLGSVSRLLQPPVE